MYPQINITHWRKGSQWFETTRELALHIIEDTVYYKIFDQYCKPPCYMEEHYIPTFVHMLHGEMSANRSLTWVDWSRAGPHPARFIWPDVTAEFLNRIRFTDKCPYYVLSYGMGYIRPRHPGLRIGSCRIRVLGSGSGSVGSCRVRILRFLEI
ncbi:BnaC09g41640D [Brassica napus]|uniref:BnaC09g41640D protein n=1 Tax=Brassica napus TaxID=3708 RepID=A0A078GMQ8_BRANA|nr:BnaC09g41640D [Brassica napus]